MRRARRLLMLLCVAALQSLVFVAMAATDAGDLGVLKEILDSNPGLPWDRNVTDPCAADDIWEGVLCTGSRVTQLQLKNRDMQGTLPADFNKLTDLQQLGLQGNSLHGDLPSFSGMSKLQEAFLTGQDFSTIPSDFFTGLISLQTLSLQDNPLNSSYGGWTLPDSIADATALTSLDLTNCSLSGPVPEVLGRLTSLQTLRLAYNRLYGGIPVSFASLKLLSTFQINNNQAEEKLSGSIDVVAGMDSLRTLWLHVNGFNGTIPDAIAKNLISLQDLRLNDNDLVGVIPWGFNGSQTLQTLFVQNNALVGPLPAIGNTTDSNYTFANNKFCQSEVGVPCEPQLDALLSFMKYVNFPSSFSAATWDGVNPCAVPGVTCGKADGNVTAIVRRALNLSGTIAPELGNLTYLATLDLSNNNLTGTIPQSLTSLQYLVKLDLSNNNLYGPLPDFNRSGIEFNYGGNPNIYSDLPPPPPPPESTPPGSPSSIPSPNSTSGSSNSNSNSSSLGILIGAVVASIVLVLLTIAFVCIFCTKRKRSSRVTIRADSAASRFAEVAADIMKMNFDDSNKASNDGEGGTATTTELHHVVEVGNLVITIEVIRRMTNNFSEGNVVGRGGFGVVYKGEMEDGKKVAVKRMVVAGGAGAITAGVGVSSGKAMDEFEAEIAVLTKVRHRNLVSLLGYCVHGEEKLLVYEYMEMGTLSQHLFEWEKLGKQPLEWEKRVSIALDVARGVEYLHSLAHQSFIHRDLKPSNILLGDGYKAKVSDFGLVKPAPSGDGGNRSMETRLAGTFGYLAPEYAVTGRVTTKADVYSFGVVLMEMITGRKALDERQPEESMHLVTWFRRHMANNNRATFLGCIDATLIRAPPPPTTTTTTDSSSSLMDTRTYLSIMAVAELAGHCTARDPLNRPDMSHVVNVLSPLVQRWEPVAHLEDNEEHEDEEGSHMSLLQAVAKWQAYEDSSMSYNSSGVTNKSGSASSESSAASIPTHPLGLSQSIQSLRGR